MFRLVLPNNLNTFGCPASTASRSTFRPTAVGLTVEKDHSESRSRKQLCILPVALDSRWTLPTAIYAPSKTLSPPRLRHTTSDCHAAFRHAPGLPG